MNHPYVRSVSQKQDVERSGDLVTVLFQRGDGTPKFLRGNAGDGLGQHDMRDAVDVEHRIEVANGGRGKGDRQQWDDGARVQVFEQGGLDVKNVAAGAAWIAIDVQAGQQNWRNSASGRPCCST